MFGKILQKHVHHVHPFCMITSGRLKIMLVNMILQICIAEQLNRSLLVVSCEGSHKEKVFLSSVSLHQIQPSA